MQMSITLPIKTKSVLNGSQGHWRKASALRKSQRKAAWAMCPPWRLPCVVRLTRLSAGTLDDDNLRAALKSVRDGIADRLDIDDRDPRVTWEYAQGKCRRGEYGVKVERPE